MGKIEQEILYQMSEDQLTAAISIHRTRADRLVEQSASRDVLIRERKRIHNMANILFDKWGVNGDQKRAFTPTGLTYTRLESSLNNRLN